MSLQIRAQKVLFWSTVLMTAMAAGGLWFAYSYITDSETLASLIRGAAPRYLPGSRLIIGRVRLRPLFGQVSVSQIALWQTLDGVDYQSLRIPWLEVQSDTAALWDGELRPREIVIAQPLLRLCRRKDGTWNLQGLLADPWPGTPMRHPPRIVIQNGTVELSDGQAHPTAILRDLALQLESTPHGVFRFEGTARGDAFEHIHLKGAIDTSTGRITLEGGEVARLELSETLRRRLPPDMRPGTKKVGLIGGEVDLSLKSLTYDPGATPALHYEAAAKLRAGMLDCPKLPFPLNEIAASVRVKDGVLTVDRAVGYYGKTTVRARPGGTLDIADPSQGRMNMTVDVIELEFEDRLRTWIRESDKNDQFVEPWNDFQPQGRVSLAITAVREVPGGPVGFGMGVDCLGVAMVFRHFPYPLDHIYGTLKWERSRITLDLQTLIGLKPVSATGWIDNPGPRAVVDLDFRVESLPVDKTLLDAMPPDVRHVVNEFQPTGSVRGTAHVHRTPPAGPEDDPKGKVTIDAFLDLNERCAITWKQMPYPISDLRGHLELHPDHWVFTNMRGRNGLASITGEGVVRKVGDKQFKTDLHLSCEHLPFDDQLRTALQKPWQATWATLRPTGSSTVDARIRVEPGREDHHLVIHPEHDSRVQLRLPRMPGTPGAPGEMFDMPPMDQVAGTFVFDNGTVTMTDVKFQFHGSPVRFPHGTVTVKDTGQFKLDVKALEADDFRLDQGLRMIMPTVMAQFARRLDDGKTFRFRTDLGIGWSGQPGQPAWCTWDEALVVLNGNTIKTGLPLEHLQGQVDHLRGRYDGQELEVHGVVNLDSVSLLGQQLTELSGLLDVVHNRATLTEIRGVLLGGELTGRVEVELETTPKYAAALAVRDADLRLYTQTLPGRQTFRGLLAGQIVLNGLGNDIHNLQGNGDVHITQGDLGELPAYLRLVKVLKLSAMTKTAFDSADAEFRIQSGETRFDPIKLTGNAFSLRGSGTFSAQGELNLGLRVLYGRDEGMRIPGFSDALREFSGQIFQIHVTGTPAFPTFRPVALQLAPNAVRSLGTLRANRARRTGDEAW